MTNLIVWGGMGLLFGASVQHGGFATAEGVEGAASFRQGNMARTLLYTLGIGMVLAAFLCYLAVIDVDWVEVLPLHGGTIIGGILFGAAAGLSGFVPGTALAGIGGGRLLESLSGVAGCVAGAFLTSVIPLDGLHGLFFRVEGTLFRVRLEGPYVFAGGFLGLACLGVLMCVVGLMIPIPKQSDQHEIDLSEELSIPLPKPSTAPAPDAKAFVALIPEEEPLVVDTVENMDTVKSGASDELLALDAISLTVVTDEEIDLNKEEKIMRQDKRKYQPQDKPVMEDHPELDPVPEKATTMQQLEEVEEQMGILTPTEELDMPTGARALRSVTEAVAEETPAEDEKRK